MPAITPAKIMQMSREIDPKKAILDGVGTALDRIQVFGSQLLVGTFIESERTAGGIIKPNKTVDESLWLGCMGLVLKKGPRAFVDEPEVNVFWHGQDIEVGDWAVFRFSSAWELHLNGVSVRLVDDRDVKAVIDNPELLLNKTSY